VVSDFLCKGYYSMTAWLVFPFSLRDLAHSGVRGKELLQNILHLSNKKPDLTPFDQQPTNMVVYASMH